MYGYSSDSEREEAYYADLGRVNIDGLYLQIDDEQTPQMLDGKAYVRAYFYTPHETPGGVHAGTGIIIDEPGTSTRFAKIPVDVLSRAVPVLGSKSGTARLLTQFIGQGQRIQNPAAASPFAAP